jgi:hypothetical protein
MTRATRTAEYTGATTLCLYLAFELGSNEWKLGFTTEPGVTPRGRTMPARDLERLTRLRPPTHSLHCARGEER